MKELKTKRLIIVPLSNEQLSDKMKNEQDEHMRKAYAEMLIGCTEHPKERLWYTDWQLYLRGGPPVGSLGFKGPPQNGEVEIGYGIDEAYRNKGYSTEAVKAAMNWALSRDEVYFVMAETEPDNAASRQVLEKLGFSPCGLGEEGPRFEKEKARSGWISIYLGIGMGSGTAIGMALGNLSVGMAIGLCVGTAVGASLDSGDRKKRAAYRTARALRGEMDGK